MTTTPTVLAYAQECLAFRRALGFTLGTLGQEVLLFARWADRIGHVGPLTTELIVRWAQQTPRRCPAYWAWRFHAVRLFARHRALTDPETEVPPAGQLGPTFRRSHPHIYSATEIPHFSLRLGLCVPVCAHTPMSRCSVWRANGSRRIPCGTRPRCTCCNQASIYR